MLNKIQENRMSLQVKLVMGFLLISVGTGIAFTILTTGILKESLSQSDLSREAINSIGREFVLMTSFSAILAAVISVAVAFVLANGIMKPLRELNGAMGKVAEGNYGIKADVRLQDELGELARSFNRMTSQLSSKSIDIDKLSEEIKRSKKIERDLRCAKERFTNLFENIKSGVAVYRPVEDGGDFVIVDFNKAAERIEKVNRNEVIGKRVSEVFPGCRDLGLLDILQAVSETGKPVHCEPAWYQDDESSGWRENYVYKLSTGHIVAVYDDVTDRINSRQALKNAEREKRLILDNLSESVRYLDRDMKVMWANKPAAEMVGTSPEEMIGCKCYKAAYGRSEPCEGCLAFKALESGEEEVGEMRKPDNRVWLVSAVPVENESGQIIGIVETGLDITQRKESEKALKVSEKKCRAYIDCAPIGIYITDKDGNYLDANPAACEKTGYSKEELLSRNMKDICIEVEQLENLKKRINSGGMALEELRIQNRRKEILDIFIQAAKLPDDTIIGFCVDVTERKKYEHQLKQQQQLMSNIVSNIPYQVFWKDRNSVYLGCNRNFAEDRGFEKPEDVIGKDDYQLGWGKGLAEKYRKIDEQIIKEGKSFYEMEEDIVNKNGTHSYILKSKVPLKDPDGKITGIVGLYTDITDRKAEEKVRKDLNRQLQVTVEKLRSSNKQLQEFTYLASHDLREPARKISAFGELLAESLAGKLDEDQYENLCFMIDGAEMMQQMVEGLLVYSRITTKEQEFKKVNLNDIVKQVTGYELYDNIQSGSGEVSVPKDLPEVSGDSFELHLLFKNLIDNALKFRKKGQPPKIVIKSFDEGADTVRIEVSDNGIGIKPRYHNDIFNMFKRLYPKEKYEGIGMGLSICKKIIERHGGKIGVKSYENKGSTFWLTLQKAGIKGNISTDNLESSKLLR